MADLTEVLKSAVASGASDLHLIVGKPPMARVQGVMQAMPGIAALGAEDVEKMLYSVLSEAQRSAFEEKWELDGSFSLSGAQRFRLNAFRQKNGAGAVFRAIPSNIPTPAEIGLMPAIANLIDLPRGLVLVTGPTGSGKSTTLACLVEQINQRDKKTVLTIEDPIEFVYQDKNSVVVQREVGTSTQSFADALKHAMRQDPDVVLIGEMRDLETIQLAITAAETGHLCLATLHTQDAPSTVDRMIDVFPASQQAQVRLQVSTVLQAVVCQQLLPRVGGGRVCAREFMKVTPAIAALIRDGKTHQIYAAMEAGAKHGMVSMDQYLAFLIKQKLVAPEDAFAVAHDANTVRQLAGMIQAAAPV